jgi:hypothetical protein
MREQFASDCVIHHPVSPRPSWPARATIEHLAEQTARLNLGDKALFTEWRSAYKRGFAM